MSGAAPLTREFSAVIPATAAGSDFSVTVCEAPFDGELSEAEYIPDTNVTGADTDSRTLTIVNKGADGNGTTVMATLAFTNGVNATDFNSSTMTLSEVEGAIEFEEGDVIAFVSTHVGSTGLADPGGTVKVTLARA